MPSARTPSSKSKPEKESDASDMIEYSEDDFGEDDDASLIEMGEALRMKQTAEAAAAAAAPKAVAKGKPAAATNGKPATAAKGGAKMKHAEKHAASEP
mmetsp:Transcript_40922/g.85414  ORF Transcript_40922/g.85414 Transcript_40922/m.85414 type:complete len:98 (+) Transcript_40922:87-380(+)